MRFVAHQSRRGITEAAGQMLLLPSPSILLLMLIPFLAAESLSEDIPNLSYCSGDNFTSPGFYASSHRRLLKNLVYYTLHSSSFYYTEMYRNSPTAKVYGMAQCRPHISPGICAKCLNYSASVAIANSSGGCGSRKSAVVRFDPCILRYVDRRFFGIPEQKPFKFMPAKSINVADAASADDRLLLRGIFPEAAMDKFRFTERTTNVSGGRVTNSVAWCTMDLSSSDCLRCLRRAEESFPDNKSLGIVTSISCEVGLSSWPSSQASLFPPSNPEVPSREGKTSNTSEIILLVGAFGVITLFLLLISFVVLFNRRRSKKLTPLSIGTGMEEEILDAMKSLVFDLDAIRAATNNFSEENTLGHCEFAVIYKGVLPQGQDIAVKRLSTTSEHGLAEMENEVHLVSKLQHKNLVRLLGYFLEEEEKLLVYEYLPNASLDKFLYDPVKRKQLDWGTRFKIIVGISRGILYLHKDSRHRIVHCNLKASNVLLDSNMNPKISEFGFAKLFSVDETERYVSQTVGTFEYMAPETALQGLFSSKSDVFSFGVLVLEIITGQRIGSTNNVEVLRNVWKHWRQGMAWKVIDECMGAEYSSKEAFKCIEIGLLCLQENHRDRPDMASLVVMLGSLSTGQSTQYMSVFCNLGSITSPKSDLSDNDNDEPKFNHSISFDVVQNTGETNLYNEGRRITDG